MVFGKYLVITVIYAPPGTNGGKSSSQVSYSSTSTAGTTVTNADSFKQDYSVSATVKCTDCDFGVLSGGANFDYNQNATHTDALDIKKSATSTIQVSGPSTDGVDHDLDEIWVLLHPKFDVTMWNNKLVTWSLDPDQSAGALQYLYAGWLEDPSKIPAGVLHDLQVAGVTAQDYQQILNADPLAQCLPLVVETRPGAAPTTATPATPAPAANSPGPAAAVTPAPIAAGPRPGFPGLPCRTPLPSPPRYVPANINLPYEPPFAATDSVPLQTYAIDNTSTLTITDAYTDAYTVGITVSGGFDFLGAFNASIENKDNWTWTDSNTKAAQTGTDQKMSLTLGGPAFGYAGPVNMDVYFDTLYQTFVFVPTELSPQALHGTVLNNAGKPVVGQLVTATAGGVAHRTYTDAKGAYAFSGTFTGPIVLQAGTTKQQLPGLEAGKSIELRVQ